VILFNEPQRHEEREEKLKEEFLQEGLTCAIEVII
jgi:hypothetical protein